jgi:hypothetical protein
MLHARRHRAGLGNALHAKPSPAAFGRRRKRDGGVVVGEGASAPWRLRHDVAWLPQGRGSEDSASPRACRRACAGPPALLFEANRHHCSDASRDVTLQGALYQPFVPGGQRQLFDFAYLLSKQSLKSSVVPRGGIEPSPIQLKVHRFLKADFPVYLPVDPALSWRGREGAALCRISSRACDALV